MSAVARMLPTEVRDPRSGTSWTVRRAWPRSPEHVPLELVDDAGRVLAGQWFAATADAEALARRTPAPASVVPAGSGAVLVQPDGADHALPALSALLASGTARLLVHRPGRRAVVRAERGFAKVVRPGRSSRLVAAAGSLSGARSFAVPRVLEHDTSAATVWWSPLPGRSLFELGSDRSVADAAYAACWRRCGEAIAELHNAPPPDALAADRLDHHDWSAELAVTRQAVDRAAALGVLPATAVERVDRLASAGPAPSSYPLRLVHRDLHDKQLLVAGSAPVGLLDLDTLALGDPALDVANVCIHLELRRRQGLITRRRAEAARIAFLRGLSATDELLERVPAYAALARLRLAAVYAYRPRWSPLISTLLTDSNVR